MTRKQNDHPAAGVATAETGPIVEPVQETAEVVPDDLAAAALEDRQAGKDADEQAIRCRAEAESVVSASQAEADRIIREGQAKALPLIADATALERKATELSGRSKHLEHAARQEALAIEQEALAARLSTEREHLTEVITGLDSRLAELGADRERFEAEDAAACSAGNVRASADLEPLIKATSKAMAALAGQRETAQARARQIGDGTETWTGELLDALTAAQAHRAALTKALDELYPDRPGAELRRDLVNLKNVLDANMTRITEEAAAVPRRRAGFADAH